MMCVGRAVTYTDPQYKFTQRLWSDRGGALVVMDSECDERVVGSGCDERVVEEGKYR
jgi:hypothetical protein